MPIRPAVKKTALWLVRPGFFGNLSPNPLAESGRSLPALAKAFRRLKERREHERIAREQLEKLDADPALRDGFLFEAYVRHHGLSDGDLARIRQRAAIFGYQRLMLPVFFALGIYFLYTGFGWERYFLFRILWNNPVLLLIAATPPLLLFLLSALRLFYFAFCVQSRRNTSMDTFLLWLSSPEKWLPSPRLRPVPPSTLPKWLRKEVDTLFEDD